MSARSKVTEQITAIEAMNLAIDQAEVCASWANDRIAPMIGAIVGLADYSSDSAFGANERLALIRRVAMETHILVDDMAGCSERETRGLTAKRVALEGGAQ